MQCVNCDNHLEKDDFKFQHCQSCGHPISSRYEEDDEEYDPECPFCGNHEFHCDCEFGIVLIEN